MRYILDKEDAVAVSRDGILIDSRKRMMFFALSDVLSAGFVRRIQADKAVVPAFCLTAKDALLERTYDVLIPESHKDYVNFMAAFQAHLPDFPLLAPREELPSACDQNGHHHA